MVGGIFEVILGSLTLGGISAGKSIASDTKAELENKSRRMDEIRWDKSLTPEQKKQKIQEIDHEEKMVTLMAFGVAAAGFLFLFLFTKFAIWINSL